MKIPRFKHVIQGLTCMTLIAATSSGHAVDITVADIVDTADSPAMCTGTAPVSCPSLRAAVRYANDISAEADTITLAAGTYTLSIDGVDEDWGGAGTEADPYVAVIEADATIGDLDIVDSLTIKGAVDGDGKLLTTVAWDEKSLTDPDIGDRVFHIQALSNGPAVTAVLSDLIISDGSVGVIPNTDCSVTTNPYDIELIPGEFCNIWQFRRYGAGIAIGPGAGIAFYEESLHGPDTPGGGGNKPPDVGPGGDEGEESGVITGVTLERVVLVNNMAGADAGGVHNTAPTLIKQSAISGNFSGANGGGIYNDAAITIENTLIGTAATSLLVTDTSLLSNPNQGENGGGIFDTGVHTTTIKASAINGNTAIGGGGIAGRSLIVFDITNTTISGNIATDVGGGATTNGTINLNNSTIVNNQASTDAPGGGAGLNSFGSGTYHLHNSIVSGNFKNETVESNCGCSGGSTTCATGRMVSLGHNIESADTCDFNLASDLVNTDPLLMALADNGGATETHALPHTANGDAENSPAVDAGDTDNCPNNDQRSGLRPADGNLDGSFECDIGAYELFVASADLQIENMIAPDDVSKGDEVTVAITVTNPADATGDAVNVAIVAEVPTAFTNVSGSLADDDCTVTGTEIVCPSIPTLAAGESATMLLEFTAANVGDFTVNASVSAESPVDTNQENNSASVNIGVTGISDLAFTASVDSTKYELGENYTVTLHVNNGGPDDASGTRLAISLPSTLTLVSATPDNGSTCSQVDDNVICELGNIPLNSPDVNVTFVSQIHSVGEITLSAEVVADQLDPDADNNSASVTINVTGLELVLPDKDHENSFEKAFGCSIAGGDQFDPTLLSIVILSLGFLLIRRRNKA